MEQLYILRGILYSFQLSQFIQFPIVNALTINFSGNDPNNVQAAVHATQVDANFKLMKEQAQFWETRCHTVTEQLKIVEQEKEGIFNIILL